MKGHVEWERPRGLGDKEGDVCMLNLFYTGDGLLSIYPDEILAGLIVFDGVIEEHKGRSL